MRPSDACRGTSAAGTQPGAGRLRRFVPLAILVVGFVGSFALGLDDHISIAALSEQRERLTRFVAANGALASLAFVAVYAAAVAFSIPGAAVLTIAGGFLFGVVWATVLVVGAATTGAIAVFLAARTALGDAMRERAGAWVGRLEAGFRDNAFSYLLTLRLVPLVPFWLLNLVPAFLGVPLRTFALSTLIGIIPGTIVYVGVGNGLGATIEAGRNPDLDIIFQPQVLLPMIGLGALSLVPVVYRKLKGRRTAVPME